MSAHEIRLHEARLLALVNDWHIVRQENCSNAFQGQRGDFRLGISLYDYEIPGAARVEVRIHDDAHNKKVPVVLETGASVVEAVEEAVSRARELGHKL